MSLSLHPLSDADRANGWTPAHQQAWRQRVTPFIEQGILTPPVIQVVDLLGRRSGETRPDVLLAAALAVRAPGQGHIYAALPDPGIDTSSERLPTPEDPGEAALLPWPADRVQWRRAVATSPLVQLDAANADHLRIRLPGRPQRTELAPWVGNFVYAGLEPVRLAAGDYIIGVQSYADWPDYYVYEAQITESAPVTWVEGRHEWSTSLAYPTQVVAGSTEVSAWFGPNFLWIPATDPAL